MPMRRRVSHEVDKLIEKVDKLHREKGMSIKKACAEVGLQTTVYYWRKRKENLEIKLPSFPSSNTNIPSSISKNRDELIRELRELENRINAIKAMLAEEYIKSLL
jgi:transposase-like protein